jgi:hypothetical protein
MMLGAEDGCNHPQPTGSNRPLICGREACFGAFWGVWDACIKRNVKTTLGAPPSLAARLMLTRRSKRHGSGLQTAFEEKTDFSLLTDLTRAVPHRDRLQTAVCTRPQRKTHLAHGTACTVSCTNAQRSKRARGVSCYSIVNTHSCRVHVWGRLLYLYRVSV